MQQGSVLYGTIKAAGGGGGAVAGARNGLSLDAGNFAVLGEDPGGLTGPANLLNDRDVPMRQFSVRWKTPNHSNSVFGISDWNGGIGDEYPTYYVSTDSSNFTYWQPGNYLIGYGAFGTGARWNSGYSIYPGVNLPTTPRPNVVGSFWAYNQNFTQGRVIGGEAAFRYATETFFVIGIDPHFEMHTPEIYTDTGTIFRLDSNYISRTTGVSFRELVVDDMTWFDVGHNPAGGLFYAHFEYNAIADNTLFQLQSQNAGGVTEFTMGNWTDGPGLIITAQSGLVNLNAIVDLDLRCQRVIMDSSNYGNIVNPTIFSGTNTDTPQFDAWLEVGGSGVTKGSRFVGSMTTAQFAAIAASGLNNPLFAWITDAPAGQEFQFKIGAGPTHFINYT